METKDGIIGVLIIAIIGLGGGLGFVLLTASPGGTTQLPPPPPTYLSGLPDDWSTAPNASYFILNNQTHSNIKISLGDILEKVQVFQNSEAGYFDTGIGFKTIVDPTTGIPVTGISIIDLLDQYHTYFPGDLEFVSKEDDYGQKSRFTTNAGDFLTKTEGDDETIIIAIAANKTWLEDSPLGSTWGNFSLVGENMVSMINNLEEVNVLNNWTLDVYVDGDLKLSLEPDNITNPSYQYSYTYTYERTDDWGYNRTIWGLNLSLICEWAGVDENINFELKAFAADGWASPHKFRRGLTEDEVFNGLEYDSYYWDYVNESTANPDGVPLPDEYDGLPIMIAYAKRILGEEDGESDATNPLWPSKKMLGMGSGPLTCLIPGRVRRNQVKWINEIKIDTIPVADFDINTTTSINVDDWVRFDFNGSIFNTPGTYNWTINSTDVTVDENLDYLEFQFTTVGNYTISLTVIDDDGTEAIITRDDYIEVLVV